MPMPLEALRCRSAAWRIFAIPIDYYIKVDMEGFSSIVDSLGGVTVDNHMRFEYAGYDFDQGKLNLNGEEALAFSRMRFEDPKGI